MKSPRFRRAKTEDLPRSSGTIGPETSRQQGSRDLGDEACASFFESRQDDMGLATLVEDDENEVARLHVSREDPPAREFEGEIGELAETGAFGGSAKLSQPYGFVGAQAFCRA